MKLGVGFIAIVAIFSALFELHQFTNGLTITRVTIGGTPATIYRPQSGTPGPVVVIAHGFAGSQQLMQPFAATMARNGYIAVTFDFLGHGRNPIPMRGDIAEGTTITSHNCWTNWKSWRRKNLNWKSWSWMSSRRKPRWGR